MFICANKMSFPSLFGCLFFVYDLFFFSFVVLTGRYFFVFICYFLRGVNFLYIVDAE